MTLKDWKKVSNKNYGRSGIIYKDERMYPVNHLILIDYSKSNHMWQVQDNKDFSSIRVFETKSQVLKYAKKYMMTH